MAYLGIDQSLTATGLSLVSDNGYILHLETVDPGKLRGAARLSFIKEQLLRFMGLAKDKITGAAYEGYAYDAVGRVFQLGEVGGVVQLTLHEQSIKAVSVAPVALKKFATGSPKADKDAMIAAAGRGGTYARDDNQADAFFLARIAYLLGSGRPGKTRAEIEVLHAIKNPKVKIARRVRKLVKHAV